MKLSILSDLHLDFSNYKVNSSVFKSDLLIIAGDLASEHSIIDTFFEKLTHRSNIPILYVLGNHEYDNKDIDGAIKSIRRICNQYPTIHFLENETFIMDNVKFIGATLWTNFLFEGQAYYKLNQDYFLKGINAYFKEDPNNPGKLIYVNCQDIEKRFYETEKYLKYQLSEPFSGKKVVITHFAPMVKERDPRFSQFLSSFWINDMESLVDRSDLWIHGHLHSSADYTTTLSRVICNPRGYSRLYNLPENQRFEHNKVVVI